MAQALTVQDIHIDMQAENAAKARDQAIIHAQRQGLSQLAASYGAPQNEDGTISAVTQLTDEQIARLVRDFEITNEKNSATKYRGNFTIRYHKLATLAALQLPSYAQPQTPTTAQSDNSEIPSLQTGTSPKSLLVLPILQAGERYILWQDPNPWREAWQNLETSQFGHYEIKVPLGDILDVRDLQTDSLIQGVDTSRIQALKTRYGVTDILLAVALSDGAPYAPSSQLDVSFYEISSTSTTPIHRGKIQIQISPNSAVPVFTQAVNETAISFGQTLDVLGQNSVLASGQPPVAALLNTAAANDAEFITEAAYNTLREWALMQRRLRQIPEIISFLPETFSARGAKVKIRYTGNLETLQQALIGAGFTLSTSISGTPVIELKDPS